MHKRTSLPRRLLSLLLCAVVMAGMVTGVSAADFSPKTATPEPSAASDFTFSNGKITKYNGEDTNVVIPAAIDGVAVTEIGSYALGNNTDIENVVIPSTVTKMDYDAFDGSYFIEGLYFYGACPTGFGSDYADLFYDVTTIYCKSAYRSGFEGICDSYEEEFTVSGTIDASLADPAYASVEPETHNLVSTDNGDGTHTTACTDEGCTYEAVTEKHTYVNAVCSACGAVGNGSDPSCFIYSVSNGEASITGYNANGIGGEITLPSTYTDADGNTYPVTSVASRAFNGSNGAYPNNLAKTDAEALSKITKITVPASVTTVGDAAFSYVGRYATKTFSLKEVVFEGTNVTFGTAVFGSNPNLTTVQLPSGQTEIGQKLFYNTASVTELTIPATVTSIGENAFYSCTALKTVTFLGETAPTVAKSTSYPSGAYPFNGCTGLTIYVPAAKLSDYQSAWSAMLSAGTSKSGDITLAGWGEAEPEVASVPDFKVYVNGTTAESSSPQYLEYRVTEFDNATRSGKVELKYVGWNKSGAELVIPETVTTQVLGKDWTFTVVGIGENAIYDYKMTNASSHYWFTSVSFPSTLEYIAKGGCWTLENVTEIDLTNTKVHTIGSYAFYLCKSVTTIKLPATLEKMGTTSSTITHDDATMTYTENVFACCDALQNIVVDEANANFKSVDGILYSKDGKKLIRYPNARPATHFDIPEGVEVIAGQAFMQSSQGSSVLETVSFPSTLKSIESLAFRQTNLTSVTLPVGVTFGSCAFDICSKLTSVTIPEGVTELSEYMFWSCDKLTKLTCPSTLKKIGANAFGHTGLTDIDLANVEEIGEYAFYGTPLTKVTIPATANTLGKGVFAHCSELTTATFSNGCKSVSSFMFSSDAALVNLTMPDTIETIEAYAFNYCSGLEELTMPASLKTMGEGVFYKAWKLRTVIFPDSATLTAIPAETFYQCEALTYLHLGKNIKATCATSLYDTNSNLVVNCAAQESEFTRSPFDVFLIDLDTSSIVDHYTDSGTTQDGYPVYNVWQIDSYGNVATDPVAVTAGATPTFNYGVTEIQEPVVLTVYVRTGSGEKTVAATYTSSQLHALMDDEAAPAGYQYWDANASYTDPVPKLIVATGYVTVDALLEASDVSFASGDTLTAADKGESYTASVTYEELQTKNRYFDGTTEDGTVVPAAIAVKWDSAKNDAFATLFEQAEASAYESGNLRFCYGISADEVGSVAGKRLVSNVVSITVTHAEQLGDANGDGQVTNADAALVYACFGGKTTLTDAQLKVLDVNGDGKVTNIDAALIYAYFNGKISKFPAA